MPLVAGIDSSTSACKIEVRDADTGRLVTTGEAPHPATTPPRSEQDPARWRRAFDDACAAAGMTGPHRVAAIAVAAQQHGMVVTDGAYEPLRPAKLWNDTESAPDAADLGHELPGGAAEWAAACGSVPVAAFTISKLRWLRRCEPEVFRRFSWVMLPHDWLTAQLTGRVTTDRGDASGTGYWSPAEERYRVDLLELVDDLIPWEAAVPEVLGVTEPAGEWTGTGAVVAPGTGDNMAAALGLGVRPGDLVLSLGTSGTAFTVSGYPSSDPTGAVAGFADATGRYLPLVCTLNATKVTEAARRLLGVTAEELDALALAAAPGAGGVVLVPHFDGERTPDLPSATGTISGLRSDVTREQFARAAVEGVICNLLSGADHLARWEPAVAGGRLYLTGGGSQSLALRRAVADLTGRPVLVPASDQLVARGAALQAAAVLAGQPLDEVAETWRAPECTTVEPDPAVDAGAVRAAYELALERVRSA
jgi:xylulokinase